MADELSWNFTGNDEITALLERMDRVASRLDKVLDHLGTSTTGMGRQMAAAERQVDGLGDQLDQAARQAENFGDELDELGRDAGHLDRQILQLQLQLKALGTEFDRTGDSDVFERILHTRSTLSKLQTVRRALLEVADAGEEAGEFTVKRFSDALASMPSQMKAVVYIAGSALALYLSPFLGGAVAAAVLGGVGLGGIIGGVALAAQDPRVEQAAQGVGERVSEAFRAKAGDFVEPTLQALEILADAGERFAAALDLSGVAQEVAPLAQGLSDFGTNIIPGLNAGLEAARPLLRTIAREGAELGDAFTDALETISEEGDGAVIALSALFDMIEGGVRVAGDAIAILSRRLEEITRFNAEVSGNLEDVFGWIPFVGDTIRSTNDHAESWLETLDRVQDPMSGVSAGAEELADALDKQERAARRLAAALDAVFDATMDLERANIGYEEALDRIREAAAENGTSLDIHTEKGRRNREEILAGIDAANRKADAARDMALAEGKSAEQAEVAAATLRETLIAELIAGAKAAGFNTREIERMVEAAKKADQTRIRIYFDQIFRMFGEKAGTQVPGVGGASTFKGYSVGGRVVGPGPRGVDSVFGLLAPDEYVLTGDDVQRAGGHAALDRWRRGGGPLAAAASAGAAGPATPAVPEILVRVRLEYPDGRVAVEQIQRHALDTGQRSLEDVFGLAAAA